MPSLFELHSAIVAELSQLPGIQTVTSLPDRLDQVMVPALLLDCVEITPSEDRGTGELLLDSHWELRLVVTEQLSKAMSLSLLQTVLFKLQQQRWGLSFIGQARLKQASLDHFTPTLQGYTIWLIEWAQEIVLGDCVWDATSIVPEVLIIGGKSVD